ncbi:hypothetical protein [Rhizobium laguerreae]|uniref:hypothetical protein n=1 Tax=Rhizobium laguerreae TaxID=1076926 RepID=UPI001C916B67|nr:hypothetical protein [Rhizobium laguerreae]MBY3386425.1 hypothetical protein [Rhizobium laguerreae]MBY3400508.1 hypothetical protein [Rhizobium laguerreae]MBY3407446.1 hypothetical protein [Rhizobium laguerreae]
MTGNELDRALERAAEVNERLKAAKDDSKANLQEQQNKRATESREFETFVHTLAKDLTGVAAKLAQASVPRIDLARPQRPGLPEAHLVMKNVIGSKSIIGKLTITEGQFKLKIDLDRGPQQLDLPEIKYPVGSIESQQLVTAMIDAYTKAVNQQLRSS